MALTICHTGDWHLGHTLYRRAREHEHAAFLAWLLDALGARDADALVIAGDVFDSGSPPGSALAMFYGFLAEARRRLPELAIVIVAGNHDSPARLAAPDPILRGLGVCIVGSVPYDGERIDVARLVVPVVRGGRVRGRVVAVPFLRGPDLGRGGAQGEPGAIAGDATDTHAAGARRVYDAAIDAARAAGPEPIVVTGHFAAAGARMSRDSERIVALGVDGTLPIDVIDTRDVAYVALGHLHLAQSVPAGAATASRAEVRYAGSPIPLSFAERAFEHEVRFVRMERDQVLLSEAARVPRAVDLVRVPSEGLCDREGALEMLRAFPRRANDDDARAWPWVEVRVAIGPADRDALEAIEAEASERALHLVHVVLERPDADASAAQAEATGAASLDVRDVLVARWTAEHGAVPDDAVLEALAEATAEARLRLEQRRQRSVELDAGAPALAGRPHRVAMADEGDRVLTRSLALAARRRELGD